MFDRVVNVAYNFVRELSTTTFCIIMAILITLGFYYLARFLKANKKEAPKLAKVSYLLMSVLIIVVFVVLTNIRY
ncbi:MAG: hypothetical protein IJ358_03705 [Clostridia bacterium]|nr:hypothetical protein [Clostridia bacterium]